MEEIKKAKAGKPKNKNEESSEGESESGSESSSEKKPRKKKQKELPGAITARKKKEGDELVPSQADQLLPESMVIDNKVTGDTKKKPPRDYSPEDEDEEDDEEQKTPPRAEILSQESAKKGVDSKGIKNLKDAVKEDEKELRELKKAQKKL